MQSFPSFLGAGRVVPAEGGRVWAGHSAMRNRRGTQFKGSHFSKHENAERERQAEKKNTESMMISIKRDDLNRRVNNEIT